jgi:hypothetical protein
VLASLDVLDASSRRTYREFLVRFATFMCVSFPPGAVRSGWRDPGLIPYNPVFTLQRWPGFAKLGTAQGEALLQSIDGLADQAARGFLTAQEILVVIGPLLPASEYTVPSEAQLESTTTNSSRWLATWVNADGTVAQIAENKQRRADAREELRERARLREQLKVQRQQHAQLESERREEVRLEREQRVLNGENVSPARKKRGKCEGCVAKNQELALNDFKMCAHKGCTKLFCVACVSGNVMTTHMNDGCPKKPKRSGSG